MIKFKKFLSALLAACLLVSVLPATSLAAVVDTSNLSNYYAPEGYHLFTDLPTEVGAKTTAELYLGTVFEESGDFYAISGLYSAAASTETSNHCTVTVEYGGADANGNYYYLTVRLADGSKLWTFAYGSGAFTNNTVDAGTGKPVSGGAWASKHRLYYDAAEHFFYNVSGNTFAMNTSFKLATVGVSAFGTSMPVRLFEKCASDGVAGSNETHKWSGSCSCGRKYDYQEKLNVDVTDPAGYHLFTKLPTAEKPETTAQLYLGAAFEENGALYAMSEKANSAKTSTDESTMRPVTVKYDAQNACYYLVFVGTDGAEYAVAYASGVFQQNKIQDTGAPSGGWASKHRLYFEEEGQFFYNSAGYALAIQSENETFTLVTAAVNALNDTTVPARLFEKCTSNNIPGENATHTWTGTCACGGEKFGYKRKVTDPAGYHLFETLPTAENPETTANLIFGTPVEANGVAYGLSSTASSGKFATAGSGQFSVTLRYGGEDATYGTCYYIVYTKGTTSYAMTCLSGSLAQNAIQSTNAPSSGWKGRHKMYFDVAGQYFYNVDESTSAKCALVLNTTDKKIGAVAVADVAAAGNIPALLFEACTSNNVAGESNTHTWSGVCACGDKLDYKCKVTSPAGYHLFETLPTSENPETSATLYLGAALEENGALHAMSARPQETGTSTDEASMRPITIRYVEENTYYLMYVGTNGSMYVVSSTDAGAYQQNLLTDGKPSGGFGDKHKLYFDEESQCFYNKAGYALSINASFELGKAAKADVLSGNATAARVFEKCTSNNVPGESGTHTWSGVCACGYKFDYKCKIADPADFHLFTDLPTAENPETSATLYLGAALEENGALHAMSEKANSSATSTDEADMRPITVKYDAQNACYYLVFVGTDGAEYVVAYASGVFQQNKLTDGLPSGGFGDKHKLYFDEDGQFFFHSSGYALSIGADFKLSTAAKADVLSGAKTAARVFEKCTSNNVPGADKNGTWEGLCQECQEKFGYKEYVNGNKPYNYHLVTDLPTETGAEMTDLVLGASLSDYSLLYGLSGAASNNIFPASNKDGISTITLRYAGDNQYNIIFTRSGGASALACTTGLISQNAIQDTGTPSGGWKTQHAFYYDAQYRFFYNVNSKGAVQGLVLNTKTLKIETKTVEEMKVDSADYIPVRLYQTCTSDGVAGKDTVYHWSGICTACDDKVDHRKQKMDVLVPEGYHQFENLPTAENAVTSGKLYLGATLEAGGEFHSQSGSVSGAATTVLTYDMRGYTIRYDAQNVCYYLVFKTAEGKEYAVTFDAKNNVFTQNAINEEGTPNDGWQAKHRLLYSAEGQFFYYGDYALALNTSSMTLTAALVEDLLVGYGTPVRFFEKCIPADHTAGENETHHWSGVCVVCGSKTDYESHYPVQQSAPAENTPYYWGFTQKDKNGATYHFNGAITGNNLNATENNMLGSTPVYVQAVQGGYVLYFKDTGDNVKYIWYGTTAEKSAKHFAFVEDVAAATVFTWNREHSGFAVTVNGTNLILGGYSSTNADGSVNTAYSKITGMEMSRFDDEVEKAHTFVAHLYREHKTHTYGDWTMDMDGSGVMYKECTTCGKRQEMKAEGEVPAYAGVSLSINSSFAINFYVESDSFASEAYRDPYVVFEMLGDQTTVTEYGVKGNDYVFSFKNLAPDLMGETVKATLYATAADGSTFVLVSEYSVAQYCYSALEMESVADELKVLLVETLNFGAASQTYRGSESVLVNANLTDAQKALGYADGWRTFQSCKGFSGDGGDNSVIWCGASLLMGDTIKLRVYFNADDTTGVSVKAVGATSGEHTLTEFGTKDGKYYVDFAGLNPAQMSETITFTAYKGETAVSTNFSYSVESYAYTWVNRTGADEAQVELVKAVIRYGDAAKAYAALQGHTVNDTETLASGVTKYDITYHASGLKTKAYAVVVDANSSAQVMTVAASWNETNNDGNPVTLYTAYQYRTQLKNQGKNVLAITNGGFFKKSAGSNLPWGMQIIDGNVLQEPSTASPAYSDNWFGVTNDGEYVISNTAGYNSTYKGNIRYGIGGGMLLIKNGEAQTVSGEDSYRTCVAITANGDLVLICLEKCSYDMAIFALQELENVLGVEITTALNMDGGGSTTMYTTGKWSLSYDICGDGWNPRKVADAIAIVAG